MFGNHTIEERLRVIEASKRFAKSGGEARAKKLSPKRRSEIASDAANTRWKNLQENASQGLF